MSINFIAIKPCKYSLNRKGLPLVMLQKFVLQQQFLCPLELMKSVKAVGANHVYGPKSKGLFGRQKFKRLLAAFAQQKNTQGTYPLPYYVGLYKVHAKS